MTQHRPRSVNSCRVAIFRSCLPISGTQSPPDFLLILPWNIADEIRQQTRELAKGGCSMWIAIPHLEVSRCGLR
ncbi:MAG: hypothetical protein R3D29_06160 [Nitratireductor sp.]